MQIVEACVEVLPERAVLRIGQPPGCGTVVRGDGDGCGQRCSRVGNAPCAQRAGDRSGEGCQFRPFALPQVETGVEDVPAALCRAPTLVEPVTVSSEDRADRVEGRLLGGCAAERVSYPSHNKRRGPNGGAT